MESALSDYPVFVKRLFREDDVPTQLLHAQAGICGEAGEITDGIKKHVFYGRLLDVENIIEELGDIMFYMQAIMNVISDDQQVTFETVAEANRRKLCKRFPQGVFSAADAVARADKAV